MKEMYLPSRSRGNVGCRTQAFSIHVDKKADNVDDEIHGHDTSMSQRRNADDATKTPFSDSSII